MTLTRSMGTMPNQFKGRTKMKNLKKQTKQQTRKNLLTLMKTPRLKVVT
jgi:hypothetical protein